MAVFEKFCDLLSAEMERHGWSGDLRKYEFRRTYSKKASDLKWVMTASGQMDIVSHIAIRDLVKCPVLHIVEEKGKLIVFREQLTINTVPSAKRLDVLDAKINQHVTDPELKAILLELTDIIRNGDPVK